MIIRDQHYLEAKNSLLHLWPNDSAVGNWPNDSVVDGNWPNDSDDDGNARAGLWRAVLIEVIEVGVGLAVFVVFWVAAALLLHRLAS
jgi:hypothetical protein